MQKTFFFSLAALTALMLFTQNPSVEAREHGRRSNRTSFNVSVGSAYPCRNTYVVQRYVQPVAPAPVYYYPQGGYAAPVYAAPVYVAPTYVEEVYVAPAPRPLSFAGLSFSWNFFR